MKLKAKVIGVLALVCGSTLLLGGCGSNEEKAMTQPDVQTNAPPDVRISVSPDDSQTSPATNTETKAPEKPIRHHRLHPHRKPPQAKPADDSLTVKPDAPEVQSGGQEPTPAKPPTTTPSTDGGDPGSTTGGGDQPPSNPPTTPPGDGN